MAERRWRRRAEGVAAAALILLVGCQSARLERRLPAVPGGIEVTSPSIRSGRIAKDVTCDGAGKSPGVRWRHLPADTAEVAVLVVDLDGAGGQRLQWSVVGIDPRAAGLEPGATPPEAREAETSYGRTSYEPLCPRKGGPAHRYAIDVYALRDTTEVPNGASPGKVLAELDRLAVRTGRVQSVYRSPA